MKTIFNFIFFDLDYKKALVPQAALWALKYVNIPAILGLYWFNWHIISTLETPVELESIVYRLPFVVFLAVMMITKTLEVFVREKYLEELLIEMKRQVEDGQG